MQIKVYLAYNITCDGNTTDCSSGFTCPEVGNCQVYCIGSNCAGSTITCPLDGDCYIECTYDRGCQSLVINATQQNGNFELYCDDIDDDNDHICDNIQVFGSTLNPNIGTSFFVTCGRNNRVCDEALINCAQGMDCQIECHNKYGPTGADGAIRTCRDATIYGPTGYGLRVECDDNNACQIATIYGQESASLNITCMDISACQDINVYCPPNMNGDKNCFLTGIIM